MLVLTVALQVFARYVLGNALGWTEELARVELIALVFFAAAIASRRSTHMALDFIVDMLPARLARRIGEFAVLADVVFYILVTWTAWEMAQISMRRSLVTLDLPRGYLYGLVTLGAAMSALRCGQILYRLLRGHATSRDGGR
ncbi:TRAP transporter small permease [Martelella soudanensis]|uniref:TRAP transporter small permease n=1 Tax=unclassified Martelella TaxID=2629616 RepID=UPI001FEE9EE7|nr:MULTISPECIES: TRAP transporter small permease [unclassified Martelella]